MDDVTRQEIRERLEKIRARNNGILTPDAVLKDAKTESSPLHSQFNWNDGEAAHQYRLEQARTLIRTVKVEVVTSSNRVAAPFYIRHPRVETGQQGYGTVAEMKSDKSVAADALSYEFGRAIASLERAVAVAEALGLGHRVSDLLERAREIQSVIPTVNKKNTPHSDRMPQKSVARRA